MQRIDDKPIRIRKGVNLVTVICTVIFLIAFVVVATSNLWLPDDRSIMALNTKGIVNFNSETVQASDFYIDEEKEIGEISLTILQMSVLDDLKYSMSFDGVNAYTDDSFRVIKGSVLPTTKENEFQQEVLIQFSIPDDFYYISLLVTQPNVKTAEIQMDYRQFKKQALTEKGDNYLTALDDINIKIIKQERIVADLQKEVDGYTNTIKTLESEIKTLETKIKVITDEPTLKEKQKIIDDYKKSLEDSNKNLKDRKVKLDEEKRTLENLQAEKNKQR